MYYSRQGLFLAIFVTPVKTVLFKDCFTLYWGSPILKKKKITCGSITLESVLELKKYKTKAMMTCLGFSVYQIALSYPKSWKIIKVCPIVFSFSFFNIPCREIQKVCSFPVAGTRSCLLVIESLYCCEKPLAQLTSGWVKKNGTSEKVFEADRLNLRAHTFLPCSSFFVIPEMDMLARAQADNWTMRQSWEWNHAWRIVVEKRNKETGS